METSLGKRKAGEDDASGTIGKGSTLFVSNLPYTATSVDLQTLFSDIAPVRSAFIVTAQGTGVSKGVGYVSFALKEDAYMAFENINKDGLSLVGRKIRVAWADQKPTEKEAAENVKREPKTRPPPRPHPPRAPHDPFAIRTIVISGLPPSIDSKTLWKKIRKYDGAQTVEWPIKSASGTEDPSTAHVLFVNAGVAADAVTKLHAHVFKGCLLSVTLKKRLDTLSKPDAKQGDKGKNIPSHASRLIVRNLPFNATEQDLRAVFLPYGPIYSVHIPTAEKGENVKEGEGSKPARTKGFAFVWMLSRKDAEKAIEGCNELVVRAGTAEALVLDKQKRKKQKRLDHKMQVAANGAQSNAVDGKVEEVDEQEIPAEDDKRARERVIAVDWALSKEKWKEEKAKIEGATKDEDEDGDDSMEGPDDSQSEPGDSKESSDSEDHDIEEEEGLGVHKHGLNGAESDSDGNDDEEPVRPQLPPPEDGTTLFIRNIPFNATEDELRNLFRAFGPLRYARITVDHATGRSRGTGFACFWNIADADKVVQQSDMLRMETTGVTTTAPKKNPFTLPSILTPDPSSSLAQSLVLHGRALDAVRAVTRDEAGKLREDGEKAREKADKRNMYLLREGVILPNTPAAATLTPADVEKRTSAFNARRALLKSNPSLFISKTRLSVRHIPIFVTERMLKRLALHAMRTFEDEVKEGLRSSLTLDELADTDPQDNLGGVDVPEKKGKTKTFNGRKTGVRQSKIVRIAERADPITSKGRSKGYGFVEMEKHSDALRVLRWTNNNADVGPLFETWWKDELENLLKMEKTKEAKDKDDAKIKRIKGEIESGGSRKSKGTLIVEFSIENVQVVQRRNALHEKNILANDQSKKPRTKAGAPLETKVVATMKDDNPSPKKRRKVVLEKPVESLKDKATIFKEKTLKPDSTNLGSLIGRKRRQRKKIGGK